MSSLNIESIEYTLDLEDDTTPMMDMLMEGIRLDQRVQAWIMVGNMIFGDRNGMGIINKIFLVDGVSPSGKSTLFAIIQALRPDGIRYVDTGIGDRWANQVQFVEHENGLSEMVQFASLHMVEHGSYNFQHLVDQVQGQPMTVQLRLREPQHDVVWTKPVSVIYSGNFLLTMYQEDVVHCTFDRVLDDMIPAFHERIIEREREQIMVKALKAFLWYTEYKKNE